MIVLILVIIILRCNMYSDKLPVYVQSMPDVRGRTRMGSLLLLRAIRSDLSIRLGVYSNLTSLTHTSAHGHRERTCFS